MPFDHSGTKFHDSPCPYLGTTSFPLTHAPVSPLSAAMMPRVRFRSALHRPALPCPLSLCAAAQVLSDGAWHELEPSAREGPLVICGNKGRSSSPPPYRSSTLSLAPTGALSISLTTSVPHTTLHFQQKKRKEIGVWRVGRNGVGLILFLGRIRGQENRHLRSGIHYSRRGMCFIVAWNWQREYAPMASLNGRSLTSHPAKTPSHLCPKNRGPFAQELEVGVLCTIFRNAPRLFLFCSSLFRSVL